MFENTVTQLASLPGLSTANGVAGLASGEAAAGELLPVVPELVDVLPFGGFRKGSTVSVAGSRSLLLALLAEATSRGSWAAVVGMPDLGVVAVAELGVDVHRLALVRQPGAELVAATAALLDGFDLVVVAGRVPARQARRLSARARHRGAVLVSAGPWPGADLDLRGEPGPWRGIGRSGHGHLAEREVTVHVTGRGAAARPAATTLLLPAVGPFAEGVPKAPLGSAAAPDPAVLAEVG